MPLVVYWHRLFYMHVFFSNDALKTVNWDDIGLRSIHRNCEGYQSSKYIYTLHIWNDHKISQANLFTLLTKWPIFCRQHFQYMFSFTRNFWISNDISFKYILYGLLMKSQYWLKNGWAPNRWPAIMSNSDGVVYWYIYASFWLSDLTVVISDMSHQP